ncbi:CBS domain-containing protein [Candidatus Saccharibacteria bacterium]|nr:CBS domain-containing protein [Candidatus Saccharibacteria bacterium]
MWDKFLYKFTKWLDPKLDKYRPKKPEVKYTPKNLEEFIGVLQRTPKNVLSAKDRARIAAVMNFEERKVEDLMMPKSKMVFVNEKDFLGPLMLDKLYKSGFTNFPVVDNYNKVKGIIHTEALNMLEIKKTDRASKYMDKEVYYLHEGDNLGKVKEEIERTNSYYYLVLNEKDELAGFFTIQMLLDYLVN